MITEGKTGNIHGIEVKARVPTQEPTVTVTTTSEDGRRAVLRAVERYTNSITTSSRRWLIDDA